jgi:hypothetical protein
MVLDVLELDGHVLGFRGTKNGGETQQSHPSVVLQVDPLIVVVEMEGYTFYLSFPT